MKITIDTSNDSKEDILKAIDLLNQLIGNNSSQSTTTTSNYNNYESQPATMNFNYNPQPQATQPAPQESGMLNMFNSPEPTPQPTTNIENNPNNQLFGTQPANSEMTSFNDINSMLSERKSNDDKDNKIKIIEY